MRKGFDVAAVHVYSDKPGNVLETVKRTNATMRRYKDPGNRVWVTETAFPASKGQAKPIRGQKQDTPASMARKLSDTYVLLARNAQEAEASIACTGTRGRAPTSRRQPSNFDFAGLQKRTGRVQLHARSPRWTPSGGSRSGCRAARRPTPAPAASRAAAPSSVVDPLGGARAR